MDFRRDINGLRAIAVMAVVLYHFNLPYIKGGFIGVDVFFVISGFLMTGIITRRIDSSEFSFLSFYLDRCRRIIPALFVVCLVVAVVGYFCVVPTDYEVLGKHIYHSIIFTSNINYFQEVNYFDADAKLKWLLHTWSLSVEWQFYILYPVFIFLANLLGGKKAINSAVMIIFITSFTYSVYTSIYDKPASFYLIYSRGWEMAAGGLVYLFPSMFSNLLGKVTKVFGLLVIIVSIAMITSRQAWPGALAVLPVVGACMFISNHRHNANVLDSSPFQFLGKVSYSIYLWHWPIVVYIGYMMLSSTLSTTLGIAASIILGYASYELIEKPSIRLFKKINARAFSEVMMFSFLIIAPYVIGKAIYDNHGLPERFPFSLITTEQLNAERGRYWVDGDKLHPVEKTGDKKVVVVGNSHGIDLTYALTTNGIKANISYLRTTNHCSNFGLTPNSKEDEAGCSDIINNVMSSKELRQADIVFLHDDWARENLSETREVVKEILSKTDGEVYVIGPKMKFTTSPSVIISKAMSDKITSVSGVNIYAKSYYIKSKVDLNEGLKSIFKDMNYPHLHFIDALRVQCGDNLNCDILSADDKSFMYFDTGHFTLKGAMIFGSKLKEAYPEIFDDIPSK